MTFKKRKQMRVLGPIAIVLSCATACFSQQAVDLRAYDFILMRGSRADSSKWTKITVGVDAAGKLYLQDHRTGNVIPWDPNKEAWAFGDPTAYTNVRDLVAQKPAAVIALCRKLIPVMVFDEILTDANGRVEHVATEPACRLLGEPDAFAPVAPSPIPAKPLVPSGKIIDERKLGGYTIRIYAHSEDTGGESFLEILKGGTRVYIDKNTSIGLSDVDEDGNIDKNALPVGGDVTGLGIPDLVVGEFSGGAHCCNSVHVFELGSTFRKLATIEQSDCGGANFQKTKDGRYVMIGCDPSMRMGTSSADSATPHVILRYENGAFHLARDVMKRPPPSEQELRAKAAKIASNSTWLTKDVPGAFWQSVIDLTYSGNVHAVDQFVSIAWPAQRKDKLERMSEFWSQLNKSPYLQDIKALNGYSK